MTLAPFQKSKVIQLYNTIAKLKPSMLLDKEEVEPQDQYIVTISVEAKKKQILDQARSEVLKKIRETA